MDGKQELDAVGPRADSVGAEAATVPVPVFATDTEAPMVGRDRWEQIGRLYNVERMNISQFARATDLDRKTVRQKLSKRESLIRLATVNTTPAANALVSFQSIPAARG